MRSVGEDIIRRSRRFTPGLVSARRLNAALFDVSMRDPAVKAALFRFIDVLPCLRTPDEIVAHLDEYLLTSDSPVPLRGAARWLVSAVPGPVARVVKGFARRMAGSFIAGADVRETLPVLAGLLVTHRTFSLDLLGEETTSEEGAERYTRQYLGALEALAERFGRRATDAFGNPLVNLSVKTSSLHSRFAPVDPEGCARAVKGRLRRLLRKAIEVGAAVALDIEHLQYRDLTYRIFKEVLVEDEFRAFPHVGVALQAYLKDSESVLLDMVEWAQRRGSPISVRLVKGAYWDHEVMLARRNNWPTPVFTRKWQTDAHFERLTDILLANSRHTHAAIASHNIRSIAYALAARRRHGVPAAHFEVQMLYGMGEEIQLALAAAGRRSTVHGLRATGQGPRTEDRRPRTMDQWPMDRAGVPLRVYVPFGDPMPGMGYLVRRLLENSSNESFLRALDHRAPPERLLRDPLEAARDEGVHGPRSTGHGPGTEGRGPKTHRPRWRILNMPVTDFAKEGTRRAMDEALAGVRSRFGRYRFGLRIGAEWVETGSVIESRNVSEPSEVIGTVACAAAEHIDAALEAAREARSAWRHKDARQRAAYLYDVAERMKRRRNDLAALLVYEAGKNRREAHADVNEAVDFLNYYGRQMERLGEERPTRELLGEDNRVVYIPKGTVAVIAPWNFPLAILTGMTGAAIVTGNTVVVKPSSETPLVAGELVRLFEQAGLPPGVLNFVPFRGGALGDHLLASPLVDMVAFTGSRDVGLHIHETIAKVRPGQQTVKTAVLEMGGKNGIIVDQTADLDQAVPGVVQSAFGYQGQKCSACSRAIVLAPVYAEFVAKLVEAAGSLNIGPADAPGADVGPVINANAYQRILGYIEAAKARGATVLLERPHSETNGYTVGPTILEVDPTNVIATEEVFGPVLAVLAADDYDEALELLNATDYALTGGIYSRTPSHIERFKREAMVGNRYINRGITGAVVGRQPFGGFKMSGAGSKAGGEDYLRHFTFQVCNAEDTTRHGHIPGIEELARSL